MSKKPTTRAPSPDAPSFEEALAQLESIIERIESGEIGLEDAIAQYEKGVELVKRCRDVLARAEQKVQHLNTRLESDEPGVSSPRAPQADEEDDAPF